MQIRALSERVTRIRAEVLVLGFFQDVRPVRGLAGEVDWIYDGIFSRLMKLQKLKGHRGEAMLFASESKLLTPKVLLIGLGPSPSYNDSVLPQVLSDIRNRLTALNVKRFAMEAMGVENHLLQLDRFFDAFLTTFFKGSSAEQDLDATLLASDEKQVRTMNEQIRLAALGDRSGIQTHEPDFSGQPIGPQAKTGNPGIKKKEGRSD